MSNDEIVAAIFAASFISYLIGRRHECQLWDADMARRDREERKRNERLAANEIASESTYHVNDGQYEVLFGVQGSPVHQHRAIQVLEGESSTPS